MSDLQKTDLGITMTKINNAIIDKVHELYKNKNTDMFNTFVCILKENTDGTSEIFYNSKNNEITIEFFEKLVDEQKEGTYILVRYGCSPYFKSKTFPMIKKNPGKPTEYIN